MLGETEFGVGFLCHPQNGALEPFECKEILVAVSGATWGEFRDEIEIRVGNLLPRKIPAEISLKNVPVSIPSDKPGFGKRSDPIRPNSITFCSEF